MNKKILLFSRDPGGANTVAPLYNKLVKRGYFVKLYGKDTALNKYEQYGLKGINITNTINNISQDEIYKFLSNEYPDFLITGTSADDFTEKYLWKSAQKLNIKSFAILDQWINYGIRFSEYSINQLPEYNISRNHKYMPYRILVMDTYAREQIIKEGISEKKVIVSGQPYFDYLIEKKEEINEHKVNSFKKDLFKNKEAILITYVSEPISTTYKESDDSEHYWGYTERSIFRSFFNVLDNVASRYKINVNLIIRLHPKENDDNYKDIIDNINSKYISILTDKKIDSFNLICDSDLICGMSSMFLIEAAIIGKAVLSIQIGLKRENPFILHRKGAIKSILYEEELEKRLEEILMNHEFNESYFKIEKGACDKIIQNMEAILWPY